MSKNVFEYFKAISEIPRGSGNTKAISDYCVSFAKERGLFYRQDAADNVVIVKEATEGYEHAPVVMLQGHLDMVCTKNADVRHDFETEGIRLVTEGDFIRAEGTTLGADDGIAIAYALAILDSDEIPHPRLECVFTSDEEIGMAGASVLDMKDLEARYLLNLDSEKEGIFLAGCAGGIRYDAALPLSWENAEGDLWEVSLKGLKGGHSGVDIGAGRGNANLLAGRILDFLAEKKVSLQITGLQGGSQDNAIPREAFLQFLTDSDPQRIPVFLEQLEDLLKAEYRVTDPGLQITCEKKGNDAHVMALTKEASLKLCAFLLNAPNGIQAMSQEMPSLTETSLNLGILSLVKEKHLSVSYSLRSSSASRKNALCRKLESYIRLFGGSFSTSGDYPAWEYKSDSPFRELLCRIYQEQTGKTAKVETIHAGVECGLFTEGIPGLEAVSMGPDMEDIHTPKERLSISSVNRVWDFILEVLKQLKDA